MPIRYGTPEGLKTKNHISDNNSVTKHLNKRKANAYAKHNKLIVCVFSNDLINAKIKTDLYKTYVRSMLMML